MNMDSPSELQAPTGLVLHNKKQTENVGFSESPPHDTSSLHPSDRSEMSTNHSSIPSDEKRKNFDFSDMMVDSTPDGSYSSDQELLKQFKIKNCQVSLLQEKKTDNSIPCPQSSSCTISPSVSEVENGNNQVLHEITSSIPEKRGSKSIKPKMKVISKCRACVSHCLNGKYSDGCYLKKYGVKQHCIVTLTPLSEFLVHRYKVSNKVKEPCRIHYGRGCLKEIAEEVFARNNYNSRIINMDYIYYKYISPYASLSKKKFKSILLEYFQLLEEKTDHPRKRLHVTKKQAVGRTGICIESQKLLVPAHHLAVVKKAIRDGQNCNVVVSPIVQKSSVTSVIPAEEIDSDSSTLLEEILGSVSHERPEYALISTVVNEIIDNVCNSYNN